MGSNSELEPESGSYSKAVNADADTVGYKNGDQNSSSKPSASADQLAFHNTMSYSFDPVSRIN